MTSGHAVAHAERTLKNNTGRLGGVQLWTALPDHDRNSSASFQHVPEVPVLEMSGGLAHVFSGTLGNTTSPASHFSALVGADLQVHAHHSLTPIERTHEHAVLILSGERPGETVAGARSPVLPGDAESRPELRVGRRRARVAHWRLSIRRNDLDVVELRRADSRGNSDCAR